MTSNYLTSIHQHPLVPRIALNGARDPNPKKSNEVLTSATHVNSKHYTTGGPSARFIQNADLEISSRRDRDTGREIKDQASQSRAASPQPAEKVNSDQEPFLMEPEIAKVELLNQTDGAEQLGTAPAEFLGETRNEPKSKRQVPVRRNNTSISDNTLYVAGGAESIKLQQTNIYLTKDLPKGNASQDSVDSKSFYKSNEMISPEFKLVTDVATQRKEELDSVMHDSSINNLFFANNFNLNKKASAIIEEKKNNRPLGQAELKNTQSGDYLASKDLFTLGK
jgi:hypothetical protein